MGLTGNGSHQSLRFYIGSDRRAYIQQLLPQQQDLARFISGHHGNGDRGNTGAWVKATGDHQADIFIPELPGNQNRERLKILQGHIRKIFPGKLRKHILLIHRKPAKMIKAVIKELLRVDVLILQHGGFQRHGNQGGAVPPGGGHQGALGCGGPAGFAEEQALADPLAVNKLIFRSQLPGGGQIGCGDHMGPAAKVSQKIRLLQGPGRDQGHVIGRGIMFTGGQTVGVYKMGIQGPQLRSLLIHKLRKGLHAAGNALRNGHRRVIGRGNGQSIQRILQCQLFARLKSNMRGGPGDVCNDLVGHRKVLLRVPVFQSQQPRHHLCNAGGIHDQVGVLIKEDLAGLSIHQNGGL